MALFNEREKIQEIINRARSMLSRHRLAEVPAQLTPGTHVVVPEFQLSESVIVQPEISKDEIDIVSNHSQEVRDGVEGALYRDNFYMEMVGHVGVNQGDYQKDLLRYIEKDEPVDLVQEVVGFCQTLIASGTNQVTAVDFGAARATTLCRTSRVLEDLVRQRKLRFIATNMYSSPSEADIAQIKSTNQFGEYNELIYAIETGNVEYIKADILELEEIMGGKPIHLMYMFHIFEGFNAGNISDILLKMTTRMLDPKTGTLVLGHALTSALITIPQRGNRINWDLTEIGIDSLVSNGFKQTKYGSRFHVFQAPQAPPFRLVR